MRRLVLALAMLLVSTPAAADANLALRLGSIWVTDPDFDLVSTTDAIPSMQLAVGWDTGGPLSFEVAYGFASSSAETFEVIQSSFFLHQFQGAAYYGVPLSDWWRAYGRGAAGLELGVLRLEDLSTTVLGASALGLGLEGTVGIELRMPVSGSGDRWATTLGLSVEAGYGWRPLAHSFDDAEVDHDEDAEPLPLRAGAIDVGDVNLSGPILRFGGVLRF